ncbi:alkaline phosphatase family protein [Parafrigoribacterium soli]|uniref:alkaline phosphatase family protein n=1 Tax=Parafrigoribacterium soli TaxID=3144663 RepID=UPI0032EC68AE
MLPATKSHRFSLADVLPSCLDAVSGDANTLSLAPVSKAVVVVIDGLGAAALRARAGHARTLAPLLSARSTLTAGFPTTTAAALTTITTGEHPGVHGLVGYTALDPAHDRVVNQLSGWDDRLDPATWQRSRTVFERAGELGVRSAVVAAEQYRHSGFTAAVLRGADFHGGRSLADRLERAREILDGGDRCIVYVYAPELDKTAHSHGWQSSRWTQDLEVADSAVGGFAQTLRRDEGLLVTADHGVLDVPESAHILFDTDPELIDGIRFVAGEPRCLQLHFEPDATAAHRATVLERWRTSESERAWVVDREEAISSGWFGPSVDPEVVPRIGDLLIAARKRIAYYDSRLTSRAGRSMVGQHGSWSQDETEVPLLRLGAWRQ